MINLSICVNRGYASSVIQEDGVVVFKDVVKLTDKQKEVHYTKQYLDLFEKALFQLKIVSEQNRFSFEEECVMEIRCQQVVSWFKSLNAPKVHSEQFISMLRVFDSLPFRYRLINSKNPTALYYAEEKYTTKETYSSALDLI